MKLFTTNISLFWRALTLSGLLIGAQAQAQSNLTLDRVKSTGQIGVAYRESSVPSECTHE